MVERFIDSVVLATKLLNELDAETMSIPPASEGKLIFSLHIFIVSHTCTDLIYLQDTDTKKARKPHVRFRKLKGEVD